MSTPLDPSVNRAFWNNVDSIAAMPNGQPGATPQFTYPKPQQININVPTLSNDPSNGSYGGGVNGGDSLTRLMNAIRGQESSGNYGVVNHDSGALGAYQIMPGNEAAWSKAVFGNSVPVQEFLQNHAIQDRIAQYELGNYLNKYGVAGAAAAWYGGEGMVSHMYDRTPYGGYPSMYDYVQSILSRYGG